ncbi:MAG: hypothetical protein AB9869_17905 [Verrucomicrobiia bacterium]
MSESKPKEAAVSLEALEKQYIVTASLTVNEFQKLLPSLGIPPLQPAQAESLAEVLPKLCLSLTYDVILRILSGRDYSLFASEYAAMREKQRQEIEKLRKNHQPPSEQ